MKVPQFKAHPWHGISPGAEAPDIVTCYIEIVPGDTIKYEIDKESGFRKVDRPQKFSNIVPALYGFIPQTYCGGEIAAFAAMQSGRPVAKGDGDPLDICVLTERIIPNGDVLLEAIPIGGFRMIDKDEADDKIIAVLKQDEIYSHFEDISDCPESLVNRLKHYFLTYKNMPGQEKTVEITDVYGRKEAQQVIVKSFNDYKTLINS